MNYLAKGQDMTRSSGVAAIIGAVLAIIGNTVLFVVPPAVPTTMLSWPLSPSAYVWMQVFFAVTQLLMAAGIFGLTRSDIVRSSRAARVLGTLAVTGMALTVVGELVLIFVREDLSDATAGEHAERSLRGWASCWPTSASSVSESWLCDSTAGRGPGRHFRWLSASFNSSWSPRCRWPKGSPAWRRTWSSGSLICSRPSSASVCWLRGRWTNRVACRPHRRLLPLKVR